MRLMYGTIVMDTRKSSGSTDEDEHEFKFNWYETIALLLNM